MIVPHPYDTCTLKNITKRGKKYFKPRSFAADIEAKRSQTKYNPQPANKA